jgi:hypothetical protein
MEDKVKTVKANVQQHKSFHDEHTNKIESMAHILTTAPTHIIDSIK